MSKNIFFVSDSVPNASSYGSEVIFYRHLQLLEKEGYGIVIITSRKQLKTRYPENMENWRIICFNTEILFPLWFIKRFRWLVHIFYFLELKFRLGSQKPIYILGYLWDVKLCTFAAFISKIFSVKLSYFIHDYNVGNTDSITKDYFLKINSYCINQAHKLFAVSYELGKKIIADERSLDKIIQLFPIAEGVEFSNCSFISNNRETPSIAYSGTLYKSYLPLLKVIDNIMGDLNGTFYIITDKHYLFESHTFRTVVYLKPEKKNKDALYKLRKIGAILLVGYPDDLTQLEWAKSSFPSKFVEYSFLGLPILLTAPPATALFRWCYNNTDLPVFTITQEREIKLYIRNVFYHKDEWDLAIHNINIVKEKFFKSANIHSEILKFVRQ